MKQLDERSLSFEPFSVFWLLFSNDVESMIRVQLLRDLDYGLGRLKYQATLTLEGRLNEAT